MRIPSIGPRRCDLRVRREQSPRRSPWFVDLRLPHSSLLIRDCGLSRREPGSPEFSPQFWPKAQSSRAALRGNVKRRTFRHARMSRAGANRSRWPRDQGRNRQSGLAENGLDSRRLHQFAAPVCVLQRARAACLSVLVSWGGLCVVLVDSHFLPPGHRRWFSPSTAAPGSFQEVARSS